MGKYSVLFSFRVCLCSVVEPQYRVVVKRRRINYHHDYLFNTLSLCDNEVQKKEKRDCVVKRDERGCRREVHFWCFKFQAKIKIITF